MMTILVLAAAGMLIISSCAMPGLDDFNSGSGGGKKTKDDGDGGKSNPDNPENPPEEPENPPEEPENPPEEPADDGVFVDEELGIVAGFTLDENIDENSPVELMGDPQWVDGISGSALEFDEEGEFAYLPDSEELDLAAEGSVEAWIYAYTHVIGAGVVHKGVEPDYSDEAYTLQFWTPGKPAFGVLNESGALKIAIGSAITANAWHQLVGVWDATTLYLYVDGALAASVSLPADFLPVRNSDGGLLIGSQLPEPNVLDGNGYYRFDGIIDEVNVFDRALSAEEVAERYAALTS
jgi:hypothetical protein